MKVEKLTTLSQTLIAATLSLTPLAQLSAAEEPTLSEKCQLEATLNSAISSFCASSHPIFISDEEAAQKIAFYNEQIPQELPSSLPLEKAGEWLRMAQTRRDLHLKLGHIAEAIADEGKVLAFSRLFDAAAFERLPANLREQTIARSNPHDIYREGLQLLASNQSEEGVQKLQSAAEQGHASAAVLLKALKANAPTGEFSAWAALALDGNYAAAIEALSAGFAEDPLSIDLVANRAVVYAIQGNRDAAKADLATVRSFWQENRDLIAPEVELLLLSAVEAVEIEKILQL